MKKKILSAVLLSSIVLANLATPITASADDTDQQIAAQDSKIKDITSKQASAQAEVSALQTQISDIESESAALKAESEKLVAETKKLNLEISELSEKIVKRSKALEEQARSVQTNGSSTNYVDVLLSSNSISEAITRVQAVNKIVTANKEMVEQQKKDKKNIEAKAKIAQEKDAKNFANQKELAEQAATLNTKQAELKSAQLDLAIEKATAEEDKQALVDQKAQAVAAAQAAAEAEKQKKAEQAAILSAAASNASADTSSADTSSADTDSTGSGSTGSGSIGGGGGTSSVNTYPVGQCTWGAKEVATWVGNYWGNASAWPASAAAAGFRTGTVPVPGAVASWSGNHVAVVTAVESPTRIQVVESNYNGNMSVANYRGWFNPTNCQGTVTYIYPN